MIKAITSLEDFNAFKPFWDELFNLDPLATPFQAFDYIAASLQMNEAESASLNIITVKNDSANTWVAIFPLFLDKKKNLRFLNAAHTDFCNPIIHPAYAHYSLYKEVAEYIENSKSINGLVLDNIESSSPMLSVFKPYFRYMITHDYNFYSTIKIYREDGDKDPIDSFRFIQNKQRKKLRKKQEIIDHDCSFEILSTKAGNAYPSEKINSVVSSMLSSGIRVKEYFSDSMMNFWQTLYSHGLLSIAILSRGNEVMTINFMFFDAKQKEYIKWLMLYQESSWNMIINIKIAEYLYNNAPGTTINFARGIYDYKLTNFHPDVKPLFSVKIAKTPWGHIKNMAAVAFHYSKPIIKSLLGR